MSKKSLFTKKPEKVDFSLLETLVSSDEKIYVFLVKNRLNVRSYVVFDLVSKTCARYLVHDVSRADRRDLQKYFQVVPYLEGARALSSLLRLVSHWNENEA